MSWGNQSYGDDIDVTYTDERYDLGSKRYLSDTEMLNWVASSSGPGLAVFVFNDEAATAFAIGDIVGRDTTTVNGYHGVLAAVDSPTINVLGVAQHAIAFGSYGWILKEGIGEVLGDTGGVTADTAIVVGDAVTGRADDVAAVTDHAIGFALEAIAATELGTCYISIP